MVLKGAFAQTARKTLDRAVTESVAAGDSVLDSRCSELLAASKANDGPNGTIVCAIRFGTGGPRLGSGKK